MDTLTARNAGTTWRCESCADLTHSPDPDGLCEVCSLERQYLLMDLEDARAEQASQEAA